MPSSLASLRSSLLSCRAKTKPVNPSLFTQNGHHQHHRHQRLFSTSSPSSLLPPFRPGPSPPRLPKAEQDLFETLQRQSTGAFSTPLSQPQCKPPQINQSPDSSSSDIADADCEISRRTEKLASQQPQNPNSTITNTSTSYSSDTKQQQEFQRAIEARGNGGELHPNVRRGAEPEFEGDRNPTTGEVGGPKNEPLRWGSEGEWSYNGRTTDF